MEGHLLSSISHPILNQTLSLGHSWTHPIHLLTLSLSLGFGGLHISYLTLSKISFIYGHIDIEALFSSHIAQGKDQKVSP